MKLKEPKKLDLNLKPKENPWFQIEFYGRFLVASLTGIRDVYAEDILDLLELVDTKKKSFGNRKHYDRAIQVVKILSKESLDEPQERLVARLWTSLHKARARLA